MLNVFFFLQKGTKREGDENATRCEYCPHYFDGPKGVKIHQGKVHKKCTCSEEMDWSF